MHIISVFWTGQVAKDQIQREPKYLAKIRVSVFGILRFSGFTQTSYFRFTLEFGFWIIQILHTPNVD